MRFLLSLHVCIYVKIYILCIIVIFVNISWTLCTSKNWMNKRMNLRANRRMCVHTLRLIREHTSSNVYTKEFKMCNEMFNEMFIEMRYFCYRIILCCIFVLFIITNPWAFRWIKWVETALGMKNKIKSQIYFEENE